MTIEIDKENLGKNYKKFLKDNVIEVERQILRDSGSTYRINGKEVRAKDIQFPLKPTPPPFRLYICKKGLISLIDVTILCRSEL